MIGVIFIGTNIVKADIEINTGAGTYEQINGNSVFHGMNSDFSIIKKIGKDLNDNSTITLFCANHLMPLPNGGTGTYTWNYYEKLQNYSQEVGYIFEETDTSSQEGYLIAQFAVWYFVDSTTFNRYFTYDEMTGTGTCKGCSSDEQTTTYTAELMRLITDVNSASNYDIDIGVKTASKSLSLTSDGKYYISKPITLSVSEGSAVSLDKNGTVELLNFPTGAFITTDASATSGKTSIEVGTSKDVVVYIKVPVSSITTSTSFNLRYLVGGKIPGAKKWTSSATWKGAQIQDLVAYDPESTSNYGKITLTIDYVKKNKVTISKKSITGTSEVPGATLVIKDSKGTVVSTWVTKTTTTSVELAAGTYTLEETKAPTGYILNKNKITFVVSDDGKVKVNNKEVSVVEMRNTPIIVNISKRSINGKSELPGAKLTIKDKDGKVAKDVNGKELTWTSTTEEVKFHLVPGTYYLSEEIAPKGYELSETVIKFVVGEDGTVKSDNKNVDNNLIVYTNTPSPEEVKTGSFLIYIIVIGTLSAGAATYFALKHNRETI